MRCPVCGKEMRSYTGDHLYTESGLDNLILKSIPQWECKKCGELVVEIPKVSQLHRNLGKMIINQESNLTGKEMRFLRKNLGLSGLELAELMGVDNATLSRWEQGATKISKQADRLIRLIYAGQKGLATKSMIQHFPDISKDREPGKVLEFAVKECAVA